MRRTWQGRLRFPLMSQRAPLSQGGGGVEMSGGVRSFATGCTDSSAHDRPVGFHVYARAPG